MTKRYSTKFIPSTLHFSLLASALALKIDRHLTMVTICPTLCILARDVITPNFQNYTLQLIYSVQFHNQMASLRAYGLSLYELQNAKTYPPVLSFEITRSTGRNFSRNPKLEVVECKTGNTSTLRPVQSIS